MTVAALQVLNPLQWLQQAGYLVGISQRPQQNSFLGRHLCATSIMVSNSEALHTIAKIGLSTAQIFTPAEFIATSTHALVSIHSFFKSVSIIRDLNRWFKGCPACFSSYLAITANSLFTVANAASTLAFANALGLINSGKTAARLGVLTIFGFRPLVVIANISLVGLIAATELGGFAITTYQVTTTMKGKITNEQWASLISKAAEVAVRILILGVAATTTTVGGVLVVGILGLIAASGEGFNIYNKNLTNCSLLQPQK